MNALYKNIFNTDEAVAGSKLQQITKEYPWFSLAHFYLLRYTEEDTETYEKIAAKTALHFNNPFLLNAQLQKSSATPAAAYVQPEITVEEPVAAEIVQVESSVNEVNEEELTHPPETVQPAAAAINIPANQQESMIFEPLHASDYFASQGIRIKDDALPNDKLGMQLKSFTSWLKTMKKIHDDPVENENVDLSVQHLAEKSNIEEDVITESMAEVFMQQGKRNKAKEVYEKLSLLNPAKSAYFASKIEQIK